MKRIQTNPILAQKCYVESKTNPIFHGKAGTKPIYSELAESISKEVSARETPNWQLLVQGNFSANILPGRAL